MNLAASSRWAALKESVVALQRTLLIFSTKDSASFSLVVLAKEVHLSFSRRNIGHMNGFRVERPPTKASLFTFHCPPLKKTSSASRIELFPAPFSPM